MQLVYPDDGLLHQLKLIANNNGNGLLWQLYQNDIDPQLDSVLADFTLADATWGQALVILADYSFLAVTLNIGTIQAGPVSFSNATGMDQDIYGYVVYDFTTSHLIAAARFDGAPLTVVDGQGFNLVPTLGLKNCQGIDIIDGGEF